MVSAHPQIKKGTTVRRPVHERSHVADALSSPSHGDRRPPPGHRLPPRSRRPPAACLPPSRLLRPASRMPPPSALPAASSRLLRPASMTPPPSMLPAASCSTPASLQAAPAGLKDAAPLHAPGGLLQHACLHPGYFGWPPEHCRVVTW
ncbi:hypothetical protein PVAP13_3KG228510 [Panicum virgatum]|uniref:Uncharacterized protein n=1 Tax=Panicum virgatum TaxID=38727 RepID=A0A8T0UV06_PANVG|nr:hypothetical protein PVAP13_3KG228510 [Panicum virgatum]